MKSLIIGLLISSMFVASSSYAKCLSKPGPDGRVPKCLSAQALADAEERLGQQTLMDYWDSVLTANAFSHDELEKNCTMVSSGTKVKSMTDESCTFSSGKSAGSTRVCAYKTIFKCTVKGQEVRVGRTGSCVGQMHDCGTFRYCAEDQTKYTCGVDVWEKGKSDSFHTADEVPKGDLKFPKTGKEQH